MREKGPRLRAGCCWFRCDSPKVLPPWVGYSDYIDAADRDVWVTPRYSRLGSVIQTLLIGEGVATTLSPRHSRLGSVIQTSQEGCVGGPRSTPGSGRVFKQTRLRARCYWIAPDLLPDRVGYSNAMRSQCESQFQPPTYSRIRSVIQTMASGDDAAAPPRSTSASGRSFRPTRPAGCRCGASPRPTPGSGRLFKLHQPDDDPDL